MSLRFSSLILIALVMLFSMGRAYAFVLLGPHESRLVPSNGRDVYFHLTPESPSFVDKSSFNDGIYAENTDAEVFAFLVQSAMRYWNEIPNLAVQLHIDEVRDGKIDPLDKKFSIGVSSISEVASGLAYPQTDEADPKTINDCDIEVSTDVVSIPAFIYVMTHELGHCLGLGHNHNDPSAIMGYWTPRGVLTLGLDDVAGALYLYPSSDAGTTRHFAPCGSVSSRILYHKKTDASERFSALASTPSAIEWMGTCLMALPALSWLAMRIRSLSCRRRLRRFGR